MILLSSAAKNIFWLGRYLSRIQQACQLLPFHDDAQAVQYAQTFCLPAWDSQSLNRIFLDPEQPFSIRAQFEHIHSNIQQLRAVFTPQTYAELNRLCKSVECNEDAVCLTIQECTEILDGEVEYVFLFYRLGYVLEELDQSCRNEDVSTEKLEHVQQLLALLKNYGWQSDGELWDHLCQDPNMSTLYYFSQALLQQFEVCE